MTELMAEIHENAFGTLRRSDMTLRDWFAGQALVGILSNKDLQGCFDDMAGSAYLMADAMMRARK